LNPAYHRLESIKDRPSPRRRAVSLTLALGIEILLLLAFLGLDFRPERKPEFKGGTLTTFDLAAEQETTAKAAQKPAPATRQPPRPVLPAIKPKIVLPDRPLDLLVMSKEELESSDIAKLGSNAPGAQLAQGNAPGDSERVGTGPNGEPLYAAEWYREPTNRELATYLPKTMPEGGGWGLIACRTIERFHVDDCVELGQGPPGSHLAGAVRQAAWQFLVRPPRVGGKPLVGEWVRIRVDYTVERPSISVGLR
jgi:periplasmic protein TonB